MTLILGAGAFGTALAVALAARGPVTLWGRRIDWAPDRQNPRLPGIRLPKAVTVTDALPAPDGPVLLALPMQQLRVFLAAHADRFAGARLIACCKGIDLETRQGPSGIIAALCPGATAAVLTGPSFAADIAQGKPTALTLACASATEGAALQEALSTPTLRLYRSPDVIGAELGGALKNVIAIGAGIVIGAGLGDSARAALMTRGYAEMTRLATHLGARAETLAGLSGLGDLVLTCTSPQSRNFRHGAALGAGQPPDPAATVEGLATAEAVLRLAGEIGLADHLPVTQMVVAVTTGRLSVADATRALMSRPLKEE